MPLSDHTETECLLFKYHQFEIRIRDYNGSTMHRFNFTQTGQNIYLPIFTVDHVVNKIGRRAPTSMMLDLLTFCSHILFIMQIRSVSRNLNAYDAPFFLYVSHMLRVFVHRLSYRLDRRKNIFSGNIAVSVIHFACTLDET